jgi:predicted PurR-regulated permease PerM
VAVVTKPVSSTVKSVQQVGHLALPVVAIGTILAILYFGRVFFITSIVAVILAFMLEPFVVLLTRIRCPRPFASFLVCSVALLFLYVVGMGAYTQFLALASDLPQYGQRIGELVANVQQKATDMEQQTYRLLLPAKHPPDPQEQEAAKARKKAKPGRGKAGAAAPTADQNTPGGIPEVRIHEERTPIGDFIASRLSSFYRIFLMLSFIPFLVYFMLSWRNHINRSFLQFFHGESRMVATRSLEGIAEMVRAFVVGNFLLGLLLALASSLVFWLLHVPFPMLVGPLSGFLSLVPYIGLPLAMLPPLFSSLALNTFSVYVLVAVVVAGMHLLALNLLYPKIVGSRVHLNPLVVTFSLMLWGFLWDAPGLVLAIPLTAAIKAVCDNVKELRPIGKFLGD